MDPRSSCRSLLQLLAREKSDKSVLVSLKKLGREEIDACLNILTKLRFAVNGIYFSFIINCKCIKILIQYCTCYCNRIKDFKLNLNT